ncbi:TatD family hydrolase [Elizabethkingia sp. JS20170427COW]|uniref:TatD family hydrolase n=1 Tax=Elizabethkingia sp. JS20170427COW TaxID=2583851 RepID=UPI0011102F6E|nr:TatD family hydrolase [Elizabethkingia sp. JS20170427COW]QCX53193.1 deoxyribonuclease [Elizabethkingia sp. JS20170427COW]
MLFDFHHHHLRENYSGIYNKTDISSYFSGFFSIGIHPKYISENWKERWAILQEEIKHKNCLTIGECGLDAFSESPLALQMEVFRTQIQFAEQLNKPLTIHCVRRYNEVIQACKGIKVPKIIHGFNKRESIAQELIRHEFYLSFGASLLNHLSLQNIFKLLPEDKIVLETDTADISIIEIYKKAAELRNLSLEEMESLINHNLNTIFKCKISG